MWNRVKEIRSLSEPGQWQHVPGAMNPADLPSRGCTAKHLIESQWWEGPEWLRKPQEQWPSSDYNIDEAEVSREIKRSTIKTKIRDAPLLTETLVNNGLETTQHEDGWYMKNLSKYSRIARMMAWVLRFTAKCQKKSRLKGELTAKEITKAESTLMRLTQEESFTGVEDPRVHTLNAYQDKVGLIRLKTQISNRQDRFGFRHPVILDPKHPLVSKLIQHRHEKLKHAIYRQL